MYWICGAEMGLYLQGSDLPVVSKLVGLALACFFSRRERFVND